MQRTGAQGVWVTLNVDVHACVCLCVVYMYMCVYTSHRPTHPSIIGVRQEGRADRAAGGGGRRGGRCLGGGSSRGDGGCRVRTLFVWCIHVCDHPLTHPCTCPTILTHPHACLHPFFHSNKQQAERPPLLSQPGRGARGGLRAGFAVRTFVYV